MPSAPARAADASSRAIPIKGGRKWFGRVLRRREAAPPQTASKTLSDDVVVSDGLDAFAEEGSASSPAPLPAPIKSTVVAIPSRIAEQPRAVAIGVAAMLVLLAAFGLYRFGAPWQRLRTPDIPQGKLTINTVPAGAEVIIDGRPGGLTPLTLDIAAGAHSVVLRRDNDERSIPVVVKAGTEAAHYVEFAASAAPVPRVGRIAVTTEPAGARVSVDGRVKGVAPLTLADIAAGEHTVSIANEGGPIERRVVVEAGGTTSVVFSTPKAAGPASGWLSVSAPFDVQIFEGPDLIGLSSTARIMLAAGRHEFRLVNQSLGYEDTKRVEIGAGKQAAVKVDPPKATLSANAKPWADVVIDGVNVGQTPLANLSLAIGPHQVVFRHPQLGERRQTALVTAKGPNRISADMTKP